MTSINVKDLEDLIVHLKTATEPLDASVITVIEGMRNETRDLAEKLLDVSRKIDLEHLKELEGLGLDQLPRDQQSQASKKTVLQSPKIINWLISTCNTAAEKLRHHDTILNSLLQLHDKDIKDIKSNVSKVEVVVKKLEKEVARVEEETDEARQRGMKGNLIITSSTRDNKTSVFTNQQQQDKDGIMRMEDNLEMVLRVVKEKTGVAFKPSEVAACHPLGRRQEAAGGAQGGREQEKRHPHSWILRIWDRKPGSNWEILKTGMKYGKGFNEKYNLNVSYMLTQKRSKLSQRAREVKSKLHSEKKLQKDKVVFNYSFDENGQMTVKSQPGRGASFWMKIGSLQELDSLVQNTYYNQN